MATIKEYQIRISAVDAGASNVIRKFGGDTRKEIDALQKASAKEYGLRRNGAPLSRGNASYQTSEIAAARQTAIDDAKQAAAEVIAQRRVGREAAVSAGRAAQLKGIQSSGDIDHEERARFFGTKGIEEQLLASRGGKGGGKDDPKGLLGSLRAGFGRESTFGGFAKIAQGGGAILGLSIVGKELNEVTEKAVKLKEEFQTGQKSAGDIAEELAKSLPVFGGFISAGRNIRELFTGEQAAADRIKESSEAITSSTEFRLQKMKELRQENDAFYLTMVKIKNEAGGIGLSGGASARQALSSSNEETAIADKNTSAERIATAKKEYDVKKKEIADQLQKLPNIDTSYNSLKGGVGRAALLDRARENEDQRKSLVDQQAKLEKDLQAKIAGENDKAAQHTAATTDVNEQKIARSRVEQRRELTEKESQESSRIADSKAEADIADALLAGKKVEAAIANIEREKAQHIQNISEKSVFEAARAKESGASAEDLQGIDDRSTEDIEIEKRKAAQQTADVRRQAAREVGETESRIRQAQLAGYDAELAGDNRLHEQDKARLEIQEKFAEKRRELTDLLLQAQAAQRPAVQAEIDALGAQEGQAQAARQTLTLEEDKLRLLQEQARYGDAGAKAELERSESAKRYREEMQRLMGIIRDQAGTAGATTAAQRLTGLQGIEAKRVGHGLEDTQLRLAQATSANSPAAQRLIAQFQTAKQFRDIKAEFESVLKDGGATAAQKAQAAAALKTLPLSAQQAIANAGIIHHPISLTAENEQNYAGIFGRAGLTGSGREAQEKAFLQQGKSIDKLVVSNNALADALHALITDLAGAGEQEPFKGK